MSRFISAGWTTSVEEGGGGVEGWGGSGRMKGGGEGMGVT
jgi:hypothetical protein